MMKSEFETHVREMVGDTVFTRVSDEDWIRINQVYTFHPAIPDVGGKEKIAYLYVNYGMTVIRDMEKRAITISLLEGRRFETQAKLNQIDEEIQAISK